MPIMVQRGVQFCTVDAFAVRDVTAADEEFDLFEMHYELPGIIPTGEVWIDDRLWESEGAFFVANALVRLDAMTRGETSSAAYDLAFEAERGLRGRFAGDGDIHLRRLGMIPDARGPIVVWSVDGFRVRNRFKTDFGEGGNGFVYPWISRDEIWVEAALDPVEVPFIVVHEYAESLLMRDHGLVYDDAHAMASRIEYGYRLRGRAPEAEHLASPEFTTLVRAVSLLSPASKSLVVAKDKRPPGVGDEADNTYGLPEGDDIAEELRSVFRKQARQVLGDLPDIGDPIPDEIPFDPDTRGMARSFTPLISAYWDEAGNAIRAKLGLDPDAWPNSWQVTDPHIRKQIAQATLAFCQSTNETTSRGLDDALTALRRELTEGIVDEGEGVRELTNRVKSVFDNAETWRARSIAATETSRAVHSAQYESVKDSGVVQGVKWLLSSNACPLCHMIEGEVDQVALGERFAEVGDHPYYKDVRFPPAHPRCRCSVQYVLAPVYGGPDEPEWGETLIQPDV